MADYDIIGSIAIIKSEIEGRVKTREEKLEQAKKLLERTNIRTVLEKSSRVMGRLRTIKTRYIAGEKTKITIHKENNCLFKLNVETCYFSPRLSNDRIMVGKKIKKSDKVLVMFAGAGPYPIEFYKLKRPKQITAVELGRECCKYFKENLRLNKIPEDKLRIIQGDVRKKVNKSLGKFDVIMMARPNLKSTFLEEALNVSKNGTKIFYHLFSHEDNLEKSINNLEMEAEKLKHKIKILNISRAGVIAPYKFRYMLEIIVKK